MSAEILRASEAGCPIEMHKIPIGMGDEMYDAEGKGDKFMPFHRAGYDTKTGQVQTTTNLQTNQPMDKIINQKTDKLNR